MGAELSTMSVAPKHGGTVSVSNRSLSLDELGGYYRPAVGRAEELNVKTDWLGKAVLAQASKMEDALDLHHLSDKNAAMAVMGGPKKREERVAAFGSSAEIGRPKHTPAAKGRHLPPASSKPPRPLAAANGHARADIVMVQSKSAGSLPGTTRPGTTPMKNRSNTRPPTARIATEESRPTTAKSAGSGMVNKLSKTAAAVETRRVDEAAAQFKEEHWRVRVARAKRRLYLYLRAYMAWISVLKKKRKGYAEPLAIESLPIMLTNALGDSNSQFGALLKSIEQQLENAETQLQQQQPRQSLMGGVGGIASRWRKAAAGSRRTSLVGGDCSGQEVKNDRRPPGSMRAWDPPTPPTEPIPPCAIPPPVRQRHNARSLAPAGQGGGATAAARVAPSACATTLQGSSTLSSSGRRQQIDPSLVAAYGGRAKRYSNTNGGRPGIRSLLDVVTAATNQGEGLLSLRRHREGSAQADKPSIEKGGDFLSLQLLVNKANARWVEKHIAIGNTWTEPHVVDPKHLKLNGVDMTMYEQVSNNLLSQGKMALQLLYLGEEQVVSGGDTTSAPTAALLPACMVDLWEVLRTHYPHKIPSGSRCTGLTLLDRRIIQALTDVERQGGPDATRLVTILLCVDANVVPWVADQAVMKHYWGLEQDQVLIVSIARFPGILWNDESRIFQVSYSHAHSYVTSGSGSALLALNWPSRAFTAFPSPSHPSNGTESIQRNYIAGSVLKCLEQRGVLYVYSSRVCDFEALSPVFPTPDPTFCGPAIYAMDSQEACSAMQVISHGTDATARRLNSVVMAPSPGSFFSCNLSMTDLQTTTTRGAVQGLMKQQGHLYSCTSRYLFNVSHLKKVLTGPSCFHVKLEVKAPCAYLQLDIADVTNLLGANCAAVLASNPTKGLEPRTMVHSSTWIRDSSSVLITQESQPSFRARAISCLGHASPLSGPTMPANDSTDTLSPKMSNSHGSRILLMVRDNPVSRNAYRLARQLIKLPGDVLILVHVVSANASLEEGAALLASFSSVMTDAQTKRRVVQQSEGMAETVQQQVQELQPDLLVMGTESLVRAEANKNASGSLPKFQSIAASSLSMQVTSMVLAVVRTITDVPVLVVKANSSGELFSQPESVTHPIRVMVEAQSVSAPVLQWLAPRMSPVKDRLYLARPFGLDQANQLTPQTQRILNILSIELANFGRNVRKVPMREGPGEGFPPLVATESIDILALIAPATKITPPHILDIVRTARTNVLLWRQGGGQRGGLG